MENIDDNFLHNIQKQDDEEFGNIIKAHQEEMHINSVANKLHNQKGYLMAKVRKEGKLYNVSSGVKVPKGLIWNSKLQSFKESDGDFSDALEKDELRVKYDEILSKARVDLDARITAFKKLGNPELLKILKKTKVESINTVNQAIDEYKRRTKNQRNKSIVSCLEHQLKSYRGSKKIDAFNIQDFYNSLKIKSSSKNTYITVFNMILKKTVGKDSIIEKEVEIQKSPRILSKAMIEKIETSSHKHAPVIRLLLYTGIRSGELPELLKAYRSNPSSEYVKYIMSKTQSERAIPLTQRIRHELDCIKDVPKYKTIWAYFHKTYKVNLHQLRATFITNAYRKGKSAEKISKAVGHCNINTTIQHYTQFLDEEIFDVFE